jgi:tRNA-specific 2-thiouridylase
MSDASTIAVAMSGGVDSSVAAALTARSGRQVIGFSMQLFKGGEGSPERTSRCCSAEDFRDARGVAAKLDIPYYVLDMQEAFRQQVLEPFTQDYLAGRTPSPCIRCNTFLKFGNLLERAITVGATSIATGHYAILEGDKTSGRTLLRRAVDRDKDQSYYLFDLSEEQRLRVEFPLGRLTKSEVREIAREMSLGTAEKPESMDLCFVPKGETYRDFMDEHAAAGADRRGDIVDTSGKVLGTHAGVSGFTVGQRRGTGVSSAGRLYVLQIDPGKKQVVVGDDEELFRNSCMIERTRWIPFERLESELRADVQIRGNHAGAAATLRPQADGRVEICFDQPQRALTPGQAAVAYDGDLVLGGGWIADR